MKVSVILAHPNQKSFNHAIAKTVVNELNKKGHYIYYHDLYSEKFNPVLEIEEIPKYGKVEKILQNYCKEISESKGIVIIHPNW